jgi:hypothetical protein
MFIYLGDILKKIVPVPIYRSKPDLLSDILSSMSLLADGSTADNAMESDWKEAIKRAKMDEESIKLKLG